MPPRTLTMFEELKTSTMSTTKPWPAGTLMLAMLKFCWLERMLIARGSGYAGLR